MDRCGNGLHVDITITPSIYVRSIHTHTYFAYVLDSLAMWEYFCEIYENLWLSLKKMMKYFLLLLDCVNVWVPCEQIYLVIICGAYVKGELSLFNFTFYTICLLNISFFISCVLCLFLDKKGEKMYTSPCLILGRILYISHLVCTSLCLMETLS